MALPLGGFTTVLPVGSGGQQTEVNGRLCMLVAILPLPIALSNSCLAMFEDVLAHAATLLGLVAITYVSHVALAK